MVKISPSILSADFVVLADEIRTVEKSSHYLHVDVMDGVFVPNITIGIPVVESINKSTEMPLDVHLMIINPRKYIKDFAAAGADILTIHYECDDDIEATLRLIRECGVSPAISIKPMTPIESIYPYLELVDMVLIMTVEPGFGGQSFMADMVPKITELRKYCADNGYDIMIEVDGGINEKTAPIVAKAGADILVAGSAVFSKADRDAAVRGLISAAEA